MRIYNPRNTKPLHNDLVKTLTELRSKRGFRTETYIRAKCILLNNYMQKSRLKTCVVALSGGIDSAVTLGLISEAHKMKDSPIKQIKAILLPVFNSDGATNQEAAYHRGKEVAEAFRISPITIDLSEIHSHMKKAIDEAIKIHGGPWANGQLISYIRTPVLYYLTSLLTQKNLPAILCGTTNRDEGAYLGFFGKASDGMIDLQLISDIHKSEVRKVAEWLGVPKGIKNAVPTGDMFDGRTDEEVFGAPYDFVELYLLYLSSLNEKEKKELRENWPSAAKKQFDELGAHLEALHTYNKHKYFGDSPSIHFDIYERAVPGGWMVKNHVTENLRKVNHNVFIGEFSMDKTLIARIQQRKHRPLITKSLADFGESAVYVEGILSREECHCLRKELGRQTWTPVGQNGMKKGFDKARDSIGSYRTSCYSERVAQMLWNRIRNCIPRVKMDFEEVWRATGVNPLLRFIRYEPNGLLIPHYDGPYEFYPGKKTLMSLVIYLSDAEKNRGATRFLIDPQSKLSLSKRQYDDWERPASPEAVMLRILPKAGCGLIFDHRILHDSEVIRKNSQKILLRTDIVFERCGFPL